MSFSVNSIVKSKSENREGVVVKIIEMPFGELMYLVEFKNGDTYLLDESDLSDGFEKRELQ